MLNETMRRAGWRECPPDEVRRTWEEKGGRWHISWLGDGSDNIGPGSPVAWPPFHNVEDSRIGQFSMWRPVNPQTWDVDWRGWGVVVPTEPGWNWWRGNEIGARYMCVFVREGWVSGMINMSVEHASKDGQWGGPCLGMPEVSNG